MRCQEEPNPSKMPEAIVTRLTPKRSLISPQQKMKLPAPDLTSRKRSDLAYRRIQLGRKRAVKQAPV